MPEGVKKLSRNVFFNPDGTEKEISEVGFLFGMATSGLVDYGHRGCEDNPSAAIASSSCIHPKSFEAKK